MGERKAFWSTVPGLVTGSAGLLTALVGLLGLSIQLGWIGGGNSGNGAASPTTSGATGTSTSTSLRTAVPGAGGTTAPGIGTGSSAAAAEFTIQPTAVDFQPLGSRQATVTVRNTGDLPLTFATPTVRGANSVDFTAADIDCTGGQVVANRSCTIQVAFAPKAGGKFAAVLVVSAAETSRPVEVTLTGSALVP